MTRRADLLALAARVEAATGADRTLDALVWGAAGAPPEMNARAAPAFTASLDAAASLTPDGWGVSIDATDPDGSVTTRAMRYVGAGKVQEVEATADGDHAEARARTAAALRAMAEEAGDE